MTADTSLRSIVLRFISQIDWRMVTAIVGGASVLIGWFVVLYDLNRAFDVTDEAWILNQISRNRISDGEPWGYQHLAQPLWLLGGQTVLGYRIVRLLLGQVLVASASWAVILWGRSRGRVVGWRESALIVFGAEAAVMISWAYFPRTVGYNELSAFLTTIAVSLALVGSVLIEGSIKFSIKRRIEILGLFTATGAACSLLFFSKATSAVLLVVLILLTVLIIRLSAGLIVLAGLLLGGLVTSACVVLAGFPIRIYLDGLIRISQETSYATAFAHPPGILFTYLADLTGFAYQLVPMIALSLIVVSVARNAQWRQGDEKHRLQLLTMLALVGLTIYAYIWYWQQPSSSARTTAVAFVLAIAAYSLLSPHNLRNEPTKNPIFQRLRIQVPGLLVIAAPFISSVGTNNPLSFQITANLALWGASAGLGLSVAFGYFGVTQPRRFAVGLMCVMILSLAPLTQLLSRDQVYRSPAMSQMAVRLSHPAILAGIKMDPADAEVAEWLNRVGANYAQVPTVSIASPGALVLFNNSNWANAFLAPFWPGSYWSVGHACSVKQPEQLVVLKNASSVPGAPEYDFLAQELKTKCGISLNNDFIEVGTSPESPSFPGITVLEYFRS